MRLGRATSDVTCFSAPRYPYLRLGCTQKVRGAPHGHRLRPDRHRTDPGEGGLSEADEGRAHRRAVPSLRRVRPHREGRGGLLRRDRGHRRLEDPQDRRREGDEDPRPCVVLNPPQGRAVGGTPTGLEARRWRATFRSTTPSSPHNARYARSPPTPIKTNAITVRTAT